MKGIRITSDGRFARVTDVETGIEIKNITKIAVYHDEDFVFYADLTVMDVKLDITAETPDEL